MTKPQSEYEYAQVQCWSPNLGATITRWASEGWDVVTASYGEGTNVSTSTGHALLRRPRGGDYPPPPGTVNRFCQHGADAIAERHDNGNWTATRFCTCGCKKRVAHVYWFDTENAARAALERTHAGPAAQALWQAGDKEGTWKALYDQGLSLSAESSNWLIHEFDPSVRI